MDESSYKRSKRPTKKVVQTETRGDGVNPFLKYFIGGSFLLLILAIIIAISGTYFGGVA